MLGSRRLNLFLLSVAAASAGEQSVAEDLLYQAHQTPVELGEPRHLGVGDAQSDAHERLRRLQVAWFDFNDWPPPTEESPTSAPATLDWSRVVEGMLQGQGQDLDQTYRQFLTPEFPESPYLWNFVALAYLQGGDLRTHQEMAGEKRTPSSAPPEELKAALEQAGLQHLWPRLQEGEWILASQLESVSATAPIQNPLMEERDWSEQMEGAFTEIASGDLGAATRRLGTLSAQTLTDAQSLCTLNALVLALFRGGDYTEAERTLSDFRQILEREASLGADLEQQFAAWLEQVGEQGEPFFDPFQGAAPTAPAPAAGPDSSLGFWESFVPALGQLRERNYSQAKVELRKLLASPSLEERTLNFLVTLVWAGASLLEGDLMGAQESQQTLVEIFESGPLDQEVLQKAGRAFANAGATTISGKLLDPESGGLDLWSDFPADFGN